MTTEILKNRYDGTMFIVAKMSNPNGDPDDGNSPRQDPNTQLGIITPPCIKRHIRDYVQEVHGQNLWVQRKSVLGEATAAVAQKAKIEGKKAGKKAGKVTASDAEDEGETKSGKSTSLDPENEAKLALAMGAEYFDVRAFGGVLANYNSRVTGPVQIGFGTSVDPVSVLDLPITVCAVASKDQNSDKSMGRMPVVSFGLYRVDFSVCQPQAARTGFSKQDLRLVLEGLLKGFEFNPSTSRSNVYVERIELFKHDSAFGSVSKRQLIEAVQVDHVDPQKIPNDVKDYDVRVELDGLSGVTHYSIRTTADLAAI